MSTFDIKTPDDFFRHVVRPQYEEFLHDNASSRHALVAITLAYHMYEWVSRGKKFTDSDFKARYPSPRHAHLRQYFNLARRLANGTKHFRAPVATRIQSGFSSVFSEAFARPLIIVDDDGSKISADALLEALVGFWSEQKASGLF